MTFPIPQPYNAEQSDLVRDHTKRVASPPSFFFAQTKGLLLAAGYFKQERLNTNQTATADKHRHRVRSSVFVQIMAAFEFCLKDYIAQIVDAVSTFDHKIEAEKIADITVGRLLAHRSATTGVGAMLFHPMMGWQGADSPNDRYQSLFNHQLFSGREKAVAERLWIVRHCVAHNAGYVTHTDSHRMGAGELSGKTVAITEAYLDEAVAFLQGIVRRLGGPIGDKVLTAWFESTATRDFESDREEFTALKRIVTLVERRPDELPTPSEHDYHNDMARLLGTASQTSLIQLRTTTGQGSGRYQGSGTSTARP